MPEPREKSKFWEDRIKRAVKFKKQWSDKFKVEALVKYYEGFQWMEDATSQPAEQKYVINLFFSSIETKVPSLLFQNPIFHIAPKPKSLALDPEAAYASAENREDVLNDWITDEDNHVADVIEAAIYDAFPRFGIIELGYSADWIQNPYVNKPAYQKDFNEVDGNPVIRTSVIPRNEKLYIKHIPARNFFMSIPDKPLLEQNDWCGYYEYYRVIDLKNNKSLINVDQITGGYLQDLPDDATEREKYQGSGDFEKVWRIFDLRENKKFLYAEGANIIISKREKFKHLPLVDLRFKKRIDGGWYPLPLTFNWISPQNELNEVREANKMHRRKFKRVYQARKNSMDPDQKDLLMNGPDGTIVETNSEITAIPNADLGSSATQALIGSKDDFNIISATSSEERGVGDRTTATAAAITNNKSQIRESRERIVVANFLKRIGRKALLLVEENFVNPIYAMPARSQSDGFLQHQADGGVSSGIQDKAQPKIINPLTDFNDGQEFKVDIEIDTMSPLANEQEEQKFIKFISLLAQFPYFGMSPLLVRELASKVGYKNEKVIKEFQQMAIVQMHGMLAQQQQQAGPQQKGSPQTPPNGQQMKNQLQGQIPQIQ